jgi:hypothetical protein
MKKYVFPYANKDGKCHDCGVSAGEWHYEGCDVEACPYTMGQRITCGCGKCDSLSLSEKIPFGFEAEEVRAAVMKAFERSRISLKEPTN